MRVTELDLSREDVDVLMEVVGQDDGRGVTAAEVRKMVGWATESHHVTYRFDKLESRGYIETEKDASRGPDNQLPPRVAYPTEAGGELAEGLEFAEEERGVEERLERLEKQVSRMRETYGEVKERILQIEERLEEYDGDLDELSREVENVKRAMDEPDAQDLASELEFDDG